MNTRESDRLDPLVTSAFAVVRYLSQISEALTLQLSRDAGPNGSDFAYVIIVSCADRAEHIAQDFAEDVLGGWSAKRTFIQRQLRNDLVYMLFLLDVPDFHAALMQSRSAYPTKERLQTLLAAVDQIRTD
ncbi:hypothetical protein [Xanthomonas campestris]|uniref:hypothetical protein n=1 Tax=Xanthomonas campestris TaxID=339 RepID=UPI002379661F|nr:hypothetical protein [Xanthomonas campestris]WDK04533.1 hypothetical protein JH273_21705 [Xanthomonas campestris]